MSLNNRPENITLRDWLISVVAKEVEIPEEVVTKVVSWSYKKAKEATDICNSIQLSGFGTLTISPNKVLNMAKNIEKYIQMAKKHGASEEDLQKHVQEIKFLYSRIPDDKLKKYSRRLAERLVPPKGFEGINKTHAGTEASDMPELPK